MLICIGVLVRAAGCPLASAQTVEALIRERGMCQRIHRLLLATRHRGGAEVHSPTLVDGLHKRLTLPFLDELFAATICCQRVLRIFM
eukprot:COSAG02_NODE_446_length_22141_cov_17.963842_7_plen_87_part_00